MRRVNCFIFREIGKMCFTKRHHVVWPLGSSGAIPCDCLHGRIGFKRHQLCLCLFKCHETHYDTTLVAFFFLTSLRLFWPFAIIINLSGYGTISIIRYYSIIET